MKKILIIGFILVLAVTGLLYYLKINNKSNENEEINTDDKDSKTTISISGFIQTIGDLFNKDKDNEDKGDKKPIEISDEELDELLN